MFIHVYLTLSRAPRVAKLNLAVQCIILSLCEVATLNAPVNCSSKART